jgi:Xaa-Pro aminopeptidase
MRSDLDRLMERRELDWIVLRGYPKDSPDVFYMVKGAGVGNCVILKKRGRDPFLVVGSMERDEARASGLEYAVSGDYGAAEIAKEKIPPLDRLKKLFIRVLEKHGVSGRVSFCGSGYIQWQVPTILGALQAMPQIGFVEEPEMEAILEARMTKSEDEVARIRDVARRTEEVVGEVCALLRGCSVQGGWLHQKDGTPLKIGAVKDLIGLELARRRLDDHGQTIFAPGREAGFPHSRGTATDGVPAGKPIIFDIFPQEKGGGYYFDFTRTLWVGDVTERARACFEAVEAAYRRSLETVRVGAPCRDADSAACDAFEERGFVTKRQDARTHIGYCHGLGHGVGLEIHERPSLSWLESNPDVFTAGQVFTVEPGLYYPDEEIGIRLEDTYYLRPDGTPENLSSMSRDPIALLNVGGVK